MIEVHIFFLVVGISLIIVWFFFIRWLLNERSELQDENKSLSSLVYEQECRIWELEKHKKIIQFPNENRKNTI